MSNYNLNHKRLNVADFQHPADKGAVDAVLKVPSIDKVLNYISKYSIEAAYNFINNSSKLRISPEMSPKMHQMLCEAAEMYGYGAGAIPSLYLERNYDFFIDLNGIAEPHIVLPSAFLEKADDKMLWGALSAEIAAIQAKHGMIEFIGYILAYCGSAFPFAVDAALSLAIKGWKRSSIYTVDRAFLLATESFELSAKYILFGKAPNDVLDKMELDQPENTYYQQAEEFLQLSGAVGALQRVETILSDSQWTASRYIELYNWYVGGEYYDVLERSMDR